MKLKKGVNNNMFKVNRTELIRTLEIILETQDLVPEPEYISEDEQEDVVVGMDHQDWTKCCGCVGQESVKQDVEDWLLLLQRFPLEGDYLLSDEQAYFISEYYV
jgi:hypothetical protein